MTATGKAQQALRAQIDTPDGAMQILRLLGRYSHTLRGEDDDEMWETNDSLEQMKVSLRDGTIDGERL